MPLNLTCRHKVVVFGIAYNVGPMLLLEPVTLKIIYLKGTHMISVVHEKGRCFVPNVVGSILASRQLCLLAHKSYFYLSHADYKYTQYFIRS